MIAPVCPICVGRLDAAPRRPYRRRSERWPADARVVACPSCGVASCDPMPTSAWLDRYYADGSYEGSHPDMSGHGHRPLSLGRARAAAQRRLVVRHKVAPTSWLDVGGGYGYLLDEARTVVGRTGAVEPSPGRRAALVARGHEVFANVADAGGGWDVVSLSHVLEHLPEPRSAVADLLEAVAPGGIVLCEVPHDMPADGALLSSGTDEPHVVFYSARGLRQLFIDAGFDVLDVHTAGRRRHPGRLERARLGVVRRLDARKVPVPAAVVPLIHHAFRSGGDDRIYLRLVARRPVSDAVRMTPVAALGGEA